MSTHEWDNRVANDATGRAGALINTLEAEINRLRDRVVALELQVLAQDSVIDAVTAERDQAVDRCLAKYGRGKVTLHGFAGEWLPGPGGVVLDEDDIIGFA